MASVDRDAINSTAREVAKRLSTLTGPPDSITRLENERWGLLTEGLNDKSSAKAFAQKIQDAFLAPVMIGTIEVYITTSIGVVVSDDANQTANNLLTKASLAMHRAHALGGGRSELYDARIHD